MSDDPALSAPVLYSSLLDNPEYCFDGYLFLGVDYIYGAKGAAEYERACGGYIAPGEDGAYVVVRRIGGSFSFGTDFAGNRKLFYYWTPGFWAVSSSFSVLLAHLREAGVVVTPEASALLAAGYGARVSPLNQLATFGTIAKGVSLVPLKYELVISLDGVSLRRIPQLHPLPYEKALAEYMGTWVARLQTLAAESQLELSCDLTGGRDSRAVFALLLAATERLPGAKARIRIKCGAIRDDPVDLQVATDICKHFAIEINRTATRRSPRLDVSESFDAWIKLSLGVYHPIYFPSSAPAWNVVALGGGAGGNHRVFYPDSTVDGFGTRLAKRIPDDPLSMQYAREVKSTFGILQSVDEDGTPPLISHYRNFRGRFHAGRAPQYSVLFLPLGSKLLERVTDSADIGGMMRAKVNYDIMACAQSELLDLPFDVEAKRPDAALRADLCDLQIPDGASGRVYGACDGDISLRRRVAQPEGPLHLLLEHYRAACDRREVRAFWGESFINAGAEALQVAIGQGKFAHAIDGQPIAAVLASSLVL